MCDPLLLKFIFSSQTLFLWICGMKKFITTEHTFLILWNYCVTHNFVDSIGFFAKLLVFNENSYTVKISVYLISPGGLQDTHNYVNGIVKGLLQRGGTRNISSKYKLMSQKWRTEIFLIFLKKKFDQSHEFHLKQMIQWIIFSNNLPLFSHIMEYIACMLQGII